VRHNGALGPAVILGYQRTEKECLPMKSNRKPLVSKRATADMLAHAARMWQQGQYAEYFDAMRNIARLDPDNYRIAIDIRTAFALRYDYPAAERWFERASPRR
jgi:hypothetical protein